MKDSLGDRMKERYEDRTRFFLPRRSYTIIRIDGKAFHTYTRGLTSPFCIELIDALSNAAATAGAEMQGFQMAYLQSDEISFLLTDFAEPNTESWFNGNLQKITSVSASIFTAEFNREFKHPSSEHRIAYFDSRAFSIADDIEVENYFIWRQKDWNRNSLQMLAREHFSAKQLHGKGREDMHEMLASKGLNWSHLDTTLKNGRMVHKSPDGRGIIIKPAFTFTAEREELKKLIPKRWA